MRSRLLQVDAVGLPANVRPLLLQRFAKSASRFRARRGFLEARQRGVERRLHHRVAFFRRRVERMGRGEARAGVAELSVGVPRRYDGQLVPAARHGARQRRGARWAFGARRVPCRAETNETVVVARHGLCPADARRVGTFAMERFAERNSAQLDRSVGWRAGLLRHRGFRPQIRDIHHPSRYDFRRYVHGHRARARVGGRVDHARKQGCGRGLHRAGTQTFRAGAHRRDPPCDGCRDGFLCGQSLYGQEDSYLCLGLRLGRLRYGGHHGCSGA